MFKRQVVEGVGKKKLAPRVKSRLIFYWAMLALPLICNIFMYVAVNLNSLLMAFQEYSIGINGYKISFAGWDNFKVAFQFFKDCGYMIKNSLIVYVVNTFVNSSF